MRSAANIKKILTVTILLNVVAFGVYGFLFWNIKQKNNQVVALQNELDGDLRKDENLRAIKSSLDQNKDFLSQIDSFFVSSDGVVDFISGLEKLGRESGVGLDIGNVDIEPSKNKNDFKDSLHVKLETNGSWSATYYFLTALENLSYRVIINESDVTLRNAEDNILFGGSPSDNRAHGEKESWRGDFDITVYKLR